MGTDSRKIIITELPDPAKSFCVFSARRRIFSTETVDEHRRERNSRKLLVMFSWAHPCPLRGESIDIDGGDNSTKRTECSDFARAHAPYFKRAYLCVCGRRTHTSIRVSIHLSTSICRGHRNTSPRLFCVSTEARIKSARRNANVAVAKSAPWGDLGNCEVLSVRTAGQGHYRAADATGLVLTSLNGA